MSRFMDRLVRDAQIMREHRQGFDAARSAEIHGLSERRVQDIIQQQKRNMKEAFGEDPLPPTDEGMGFCLRCGISIAESLAETRERPALTKRRPEKGVCGMCLEELDAKQFFEEGELSRGLLIGLGILDDG